MKKLLLILAFALCYFISFSQTPTIVWRSSPSFTAGDYRLKAGLNFILPVANDTTLNNGLDSLGSMIYRKLDSSVYVRVPGIGVNRWIKLLRLGDASSGNVSSVGLSMPAAFNVSGSPITSTGIFTVSGAGNSGQYVNGAGNLTTFPAIPAQFNPIAGTGISLSGSYPNITFNSLTSGTVTTFSSGNLVPLFTTSVSNASTTPGLSFTLSNAAAHTFFMNNTGSTALPGFQAMGIADLPTGIPNANLANSTIGLGTGTAGTDVGVTGTPAALGGTLTLNIPIASGTNTGKLSNADWLTFSSKVGTIGTINSQTKSANGGVITGGSLVFQTADGTHPGLMTALQDLQLDSLYTGKLADTLANPQGAFPDSLLMHPSAHRFLWRALVAGSGISLTPSDTTIVINNAIGASTLDAVLVAGNRSQHSSYVDSSVGNVVKSNSYLFAGTGINYPKKSIIWYGDSWTAGAGVSNGPSRFSSVDSRLASDSEINRGIPGTTLTQFNPGDSSMINRLYTVPAYSSSIYAAIVFQYGTNETTEDTTSFKANYKRVLDTCVARGWPLSKIFLFANGYYIKVGYDTVKIRLATIHFGFSYGVKVVDMYTAMLQRVNGNPFNVLVTGDSLHPNGLGNQVIAQAGLDTLNAAGYILEGEGRVFGRLYVDKSIIIHKQQDDNLLTIFDTTANDAVTLLNILNPPGTKALQIQFPSQPSASSDPPNRIDMGGKYYSGARDTSQIKLLFYNSGSERVGISGLSTVAGMEFFLGNNRGATFYNGNVNIADGGLSVTLNTTDFGTYYAVPPQNNTYGLILQGAAYNGALGLPQYTGIDFPPFPSSTDSFSIKHELSSGFHDPLNFFHNNTSIFHIGAGTETYPFTFDVPGISFAASTSSIESLNIAAGTAPSSPVDGAIWYNSSTHNLDARLNGVTYSLNLNLYQKDGTLPGNRTVTQSSHWIDFTGEIYNNHLYGNGTAPSITAGTGAGTSPTVSVSGTDEAGIITIVPGVGGSTSAALVTITYHNTYAAKPVVVITPANAASGILVAGIMPYINDTNCDGTKFEFDTGTSALTAATTYKFYYHVIGYDTSQ